MLNLGDRMKLYENTFQINLPPRTPLIIRVDGKAFHTFTKGLEPFDDRMYHWMTAVGWSLMKNIQGAELAYIQSDECSVLIHDWYTHETQSWYGKNLQKLVSVSASLATIAFERARLWSNTNPQHTTTPAYFDSRAWTLPKEEVANYFIWRQKDAERNSINTLGQYHFSQKQLHGLSCKKVQEKLFIEKNVNWSLLPPHKKNGWCVVKYFDGTVATKTNCPIFTENREFIERHLKEEPEWNSQQFDSLQIETELNQKP